MYQYCAVVTDKHYGIAPFKEQEEPVVFSDWSRSKLLLLCRSLSRRTVVLSTVNLRILTPRACLRTTRYTLLLSVEVLGYDAEKPKAMFPFANSISDFFASGQCHDVQLNSGHRSQVNYVPELPDVTLPVASGGKRKRGSKAAPAAPVDKRREALAKAEHKTAAALRSTC